MNIAGKSFQLVIKNASDITNVLFHDIVGPWARTSRVIKFGYIKVKFTAKDVSVHTIVLSTYISKCYHITIN